MKHRIGLAALAALMACAKAAPAPSVGGLEVIEHTFRLAWLRDAASGTHPAVVGRSRIIEPGGEPAEEVFELAAGVEIRCARDEAHHVVSAGIDTRVADLRRLELSGECVDILPGIPIVVRFVADP